MSGTVIALDPGTADEILFSEVVAGDTPTLWGDSGLGPYRAVFERL